MHNYPPVDDNMAAISENDTTNVVSVEEVLSYLQVVLIIYLIGFKDVCGFVCCFCGFAISLTSSLCKIAEEIVISYDLKPSVIHTYIYIHKKLFKHVSPNIFR